MDLAADISHVSDYAEMAALGVLRTPAVIVDGKIVSMGRVPSVAELKTMLGGPRAEALDGTLKRAPRPL
jgi:hypothetical protein